MRYAPAWSLKLKLVPKSKVLLETFNQNMITRQFQLFKSPLFDEKRIVYGHAILNVANVV